jgi:predicted ATP-dependent endonuclease of OLD family
MLLKTFHIHKFQSITDSNPAEVGDITCLVGKNEAGKTALLKALYRLNPIENGQDKFDVTDDYPRSSVTQYEQQVKAGKQSPEIVTAATFALEAEELRPIEEHFGEDVLPEATVTLSRGYENKTTFTLKVDEKIAGQTLLAKARIADAVKQEALVWNSVKELAGILEQRGQAQQAKFNQAITAANAMADADEKAKATAAAQPLQESAAAKALRAELQAINEAGLRKHIYDKYLAAALPQFLYFDEYYQMRGCENIEALQQRIASGALLPSDHPLIGLVELAGLQFADLLNPSRTQELKNKLQGAGNHLTNQILKYWSQNRHLRLAFDVRPARPGDPEGMRSGTNIWAEVADQKHHVNTALGTRSRGFVWFFSFLAWYSRLKATMGRRLILLLDEPGLSLHAKAQEDLLRYFEQELKGDHQLIYSTHSPFMVDPNHFDRIRIVQDKSIDSDTALTPEEEGTKVLVDVLEAGPDSLFPLQGALGYEIYQTLFIGPNNVVVEGASDLLYIQALSAILNQSGKESLNDAWTITPVGGADKVSTFVALIGAQKAVLVATLIDFQKTSVQMIENLYKRKLLSKNRLLTFADFTGKSESDIEDMFEPDFYLKLVNEEYKKQLTKPVELADLNMHHPRIVVSIEEYLGKNPLTSGTFNHYRPARYFVENSRKLGKTLSAATLTRFEAAFKTLNSLLTAKS